MTAEKKALELVNKIQVEHQKENEVYVFHMSVESAKRTALIFCDELLEFEDSIVQQLHKISTDAGAQFRHESKYWNLVKTEIQKL